MITKAHQNTRSEIQGLAHTVEKFDLTRTKCINVAVSGMRKGGRRGGKKQEEEVAIVTCPGEPLSKSHIGVKRVSEMHETPWMVAPGCICFTWLYLAVHGCTRLLYLTVQCIWLCMAVPWSTWLYMAGVVNPF